MQHSPQDTGQPEAPPTSTLPPMPPIPPYTSGTFFHGGLEFLIEGGGLFVNSTMLEKKRKEFEDSDAC